MCGRYMCVFVEILPKPYATVTNLAIFSFHFLPCVVCLPYTFESLPSLLLRQQQVTLRHSNNDYVSPRFLILHSLYFCKNFVNGGHGIVREKKIPKENFFEEIYFEILGWKKDEMSKLLGVMLSKMILC